MSAPVTPRPRYTRDHPCPICGGWEGAPRGTGTRCYGFRSGNGGYGRCTRDEHAGNLPMDQTTEAYVHRLIGDCNCGTRHDPTLPMQANGEHEPRRIVATFDYTDETGRMLFQTVKYEPKTFRQRQPDGDGWKWTTAGVRLVPYRLPALMDQTREDRTVFIPGARKTRTGWPRSD